jgi:ubiquinone/menaquinone biosynthesis C-methylase UbiE
MRKSWATRTRDYAKDAAPNTAVHAERLLQMVPPRAGDRVLDVAAGPGTVAIQAARRVGPQGRVVATDLTPEWADVIAERYVEAGVENIEFRAMGAEALDFPDDSFDVAYCQFGLMFVPDPVQALREMRRVLKPGGRLGVVVWSTPDKVLCFSAVAKHLAPHLPQVAPEEQIPTPLSLGQPGLIEGMVAQAGFRDVRPERHTLDFVSASPEDMWQERVLRGQPSIQEAVGRLSADERERLHSAVVGDLQQYVHGGKVRLPSEAIYVTAVK